MKTRLKVSVVVAATAVTCQVSAANVWYVDSNNYGKTGLDGSEANAFGTIQDAIDNALCVDGDTIKVLPGIYDKGGRAEGASQYLTRVFVDKALVVEATSGDPAATVILGQWDSEQADGIGPNAVRCVSASNGAIIRGFTLRDGAAHDAVSSGSLTYAGGFRGSTGDSVNDDNAYLVDCVITNCTAPRGPAMFGGTALRCRFVGNVGGCVRQARLINCLLTGNADGNVVFTGRLYNTTVVNNDNYAIRGVSAIYNCAIQFNASGTSAFNQDLPASHSFAVPWNSSSAVPPDCVTNSTDLVFLSPATGDFHPMAGTDIAGVGAASILSGLDPALPASLDAFVDLDGEPIPTTGAIMPGAFQTAVAPATVSGAIKFDGPVIANGVRSFMNGVYCRTPGGPGEVHLAVETTGGKEFVCFSCPEMAGSAIYPQMDDTVWTMTPTNTAAGDFSVGYTTEIAAANNVFYVNPDPAIGSDANDGLSADSPFLTLTNAVTKANHRSVIHAAAGVYTNGYFESTFGNYRIFNDTMSYLRIKGAGASLSFIYGAKATGTESLEDGRGNDAVRCAYLNRSTCIQGFTLGNSYSKTGDANDNSCRGGIVCVPSSANYGQISDCVLTNGWAYRAGVAYRAVLRRCVITGASMSTGSGQQQMRGCIVSSCLFVGNHGTDTVIASDNNVQHCTIITEPGKPVLASSVVPQNTLVYAPVGVALPTSGIGCFFSSNLNDFYFADEEAGDWRVATCSPAVGIGETPSFANYSSDLTGNPLIWADGHPMAGACQGTYVYSPNWYVDPQQGSNANSGRTDGLPVKTLSAVLSNPKLRPGDVVHLAPGTYDGTYGGTENETFDLSGVKYRLIVPAGITVVGDGGAADTILNARGTAENPIRGAYVNADATLRGVTICGAYSDQSNAEAAGFRANGATACLVSCIISNNYNSVDKGTSAGNGGSLYGCIVDHNRGYYTGYSIPYIENCTFGGDNLRTNGTTDADLTRGGALAVVNSLMLGGSCTMKTTCFVTNCIFTASAFSGGNVPGEEIGSLHTNLEVIALGADYRPGKTGVAVDFCADAMPNERLDADVFGGQRVYNGVVDCGAVEYDWRGDYAAFLGGTDCVVSNASPDVVLRDGQLAVRGSIDFTVGKWQPGLETFRYPISVSGAGTATVSLNGVPYASFTAADGEQTITFKNAATVNHLVVAFESEEGVYGAAMLEKRQPVSGAVMFLR